MTQADTRACQTYHPDPNCLAHLTPPTIASSRTLKPAPAGYLAAVP